MSYADDAVVYVCAGKWDSNGNLLHLCTFILFLHYSNKLKCFMFRITRSLELVIDVLLF